MLERGTTNGTAANGSGEFSLSVAPDATPHHLGHWLCYPAGGREWPHAPWTCAWRPRPPTWATWW
ncbi:MAG: hypothetical protein WKG07_27030 [Hymenobacter sp.]